MTGEHVPSCLLCSWAGFDVPVMRMAQPYGVRVSMPPSPELMRAERLDYTVRACMYASLRHQPARSVY